MNSVLISLVRLLIVYALSSGVQATPIILVSVETLQGNNSIITPVLPNAMQFDIRALELDVLTLPPTDVVAYDVATKQVIQVFPDRTLSDALIELLVSEAYLSAYFEELQSYFNPHPNQIASGAMNAQGVYVVINEDPYLSPPTPLDEIDSDNDGINDFDEMNVDSNSFDYTVGVDTDPLNADTDGDNVSDGDEVNVYGSNPLLTNSDNDGLSDGEEVNIYATNPIVDDTDMDGFNDDVEVAAGSDPLNMASVPSPTVANVPLPLWSLMLLTVLLVGIVIINRRHQQNQIVTI